MVSLLNDAKNGGQFNDAEPVEQASEAQSDGGAAGAHSDGTDPFEGVDFGQLADDVETLCNYGATQYDAVNKVMNNFRFDFLHRLRQELKARSTQQWKQETFERLKKEFEQEK